MPTFDVGTGKSASGGYETLAAWQTARATAARNGTPEIARLFAANMETAGFALTGWTNIDDTVYVSIEGQTAMDGTVATGALISSSGSFCISLGTCAVVKFKNLRITTSGASGVGIGDLGGVKKVTGENLVVFGCPGYGIDHLSSNAASTIVYNNCISVRNARGFNAHTGAVTPSAFNCLAYGNQYGFLQFNAKNCISVGNTTDQFFNDSASSDYNISGNTSGSGANTKKSVSATVSATPGAGTWVGFTNITSGSENFNLISFTDGSTNWAIDTANAATATTTDMTGATRSGNGSGPDKGPLELIAAGGGSFQAAWARGSNILIGGAIR